MDVSTRREGHIQVVVVQGDWHLGTPVPDADEVLTNGQADGTVAVESRELGDWDTSLLVFLLDLAETVESRGGTLQLDELPADVRSLLTMARAVPEHDVERDRPPESWIEFIGERTVDLWNGTKHFVHFTGEVAISAFRVATGRGEMRWRDFWWTLQRSSASALGIVTLIAFLVGLILSFLGAVVLRRFGADYYVSYLISYGMLRELGALMTAIIMAGRTGAAFAAELGSMKISEEIDALKTLGLSPVDVLVLPRVAAIFIALPLLTIYADLVGIFGGWFVAVQMLDVTTPQFFSGLIAPVTLADAVLGVVKGTVYGAIVGLTGCLRGMRTGNDAAAVGDAATSAVVTGITLIVLANAIIDWMAALLNI
ncbi:ABC transporter permease [Longibacter salinarum]|uniref:ABC transporter permease n=1 Tax=Longibacter salinarum TaxID=1850348 RepID=A0A2A8CVA8_9BACT|nr:ABC transporter permease [Longibacter salinarum]PEN12586.1 ABC transporter permease [Longibacter salinarum]